MHVLIFSIVHTHKFELATDKEHKITSLDGVSTYMYIAHHELHVSSTRGFSSSHGDLQQWTHFIIQLYTILQLHVYIYIVLHLRRCTCSTIKAYCVISMTGGHTHLLGKVSSWDHCNSQRERGGGGGDGGRGSQMKQSTQVFFLENAYMHMKL